MSPGGADDADQLHQRRTRWLSLASSLGSKRARWPTGPSAEARCLSLELRAITPSVMTSVGVESSCRVSLVFPLWLQNSEISGVTWSAGGSAPDSEAGQHKTRYFPNDFHDPLPARTVPPLHRPPARASHTTSVDC